MEGLLNVGFESYTILGCCLCCQFPMPKVSTDERTKILSHSTPSWEGLHSLIDLCSGFGGLAQGAIAAGMHVTVAVDQNPKMLSLYGKISEATKICGDFGCQEVLVDIWQNAKGAKVLSSGFSCQPYSRLGDCRSEQDSRSNCITKTLAAAYYLQVRAVILECVSPAGQDQFVCAELDRFLKATGFSMSQIDMRLDSIWPCRRQRAWWLIVAPELGAIDLKVWDCLKNISQVQQVIPRILPWAIEDEENLTLDQDELQAFGVHEGSHGKHLLNGKGHAPCALHAWGNQLRPCPCECRAFPLPSARLESKGLHGCLVRSAETPERASQIRHIHPNEAMALNTMDPILDFGCPARLTLSAVGQLAAPVQALWVISHFIERIEEMMTGSSKQTPSAQIQAYRSWILMRCRQVWPVDNEMIFDQKLIQMMEFWQDVQGLSLEELVFPLKWNDKIQEPVSIAAVLDHLIKSHSNRIPATVPDEPGEDMTPTPWYDEPCVVDDTTTVACMYADSCTVLFEGSSDSPIRFQPKCSSTVGNFLDAQEKLVGKLVVEHILLNGREITPEHIMEVGQVIVVKLAAQSHSKQKAHMPDMNPVQVSPTLDWSVDPIEDVHIKSPPRKVSKFDVGECVIPTKDAVSEDVWLDAFPLLGLRGEQFLKLQAPMINNPQQLWSVRHQFLKSEDRLAVLAQQDTFWADDEIRLHMHSLAKQYVDHSLKKGFKPVDIRSLTHFLARLGFHRRVSLVNYGPEITLKSVPSPI